MAFGHILFPYFVDDLASDYSKMNITEVKIIIFNNYCKNKFLFF